MKLDILPDCMMPDGAEPCKGYLETHDKLSIVEVDLKELHQALYYMYSQNQCGCGNPACNRCDDDLDNGEVLQRIGKKYDL